MTTTKEVQRVSGGEEESTATSKSSAPTRSV